MSNSQYPSHPGQNDYVQVPQNEYEALKRENAQLHALLHGVKNQDSNAEIDTLASECRALRAMNAKAQEEIAMLKENQRLRKFPDEKPEWGKEVLVLDHDGDVQQVRFSCDYKWISWGCMQTCESSCVAYWMPKPKSPEVGNESNKV